MCRGQLPRLAASMLCLDKNFLRSLPGDIHGSDASVQQVVAAHCSRIPMMQISNYIIVCPTSHRIDKLDAVGIVGAARHLPDDYIDASFEALALHHAAACGGPAVEAMLARSFAVDHRPFQPKVRVL